MWRATRKSLLAKKLRLALTTFAVVLRIGFMAGTLDMLGAISYG